VTKDEIDLVILIPDLDTLKAKGINVGDLSNEEFVKRFSAYTDAYGPINGRKVVVKPVAWDPLDATSFDKACIAATQDSKPLAVINGTGFEASAFPCIAVDNKTPLITGDMAYNALYKEAGKNLLTLGLSAEVAATSAADLIAKTKAIPTSAKIGIISNNRPQIKAAGDTLEARLKKHGYDVVEKVELNGLSADSGIQARESAAAADTFQAKGVDTVFNLQTWTQMNGFLGEVTKNNLNFKLYALDGQANTCTPTSVARTASTVVGATCITAWSAKPLPTKDGMKPDNALEAKCRKQYDAVFDPNSLPGGGAGSTVVGGVTYPGDIAPNECTIASVLLPAIKKAGKNLTWDKVYANLIATTDAPAAYMSNGKGGFGKNKPYFANPIMHFETVSGASADTAKDAKGLYNGCALPANCWIPTLVNGQEWFDMSGKG
jgi:hypothetical protein